MLIGSQQDFFRPPGGGLQRCVPLAEGSVIKAEVLCTGAEFVAFGQAMALQARVRLMTDVEQMRDADARTDTKKRAGEVIDNASFARQLYASFPHGGRAGKQRRFMMHAMEILATSVWTMWLCGMFFFFARNNLVYSEIE